MNHSTVASQSGRVMPFVILAVVLSPGPIRADAIRRVPIFRTGTVSEVDGRANLVLSNVYGTAVPEIVTCSLGKASALTRSGNGYVPVWETDSIDCSAVAAGDLDGDGATEVVIGTKPNAQPGSILVFTPHRFGHARASVKLPVALPVNDVAVGNVDNDAALEIVAVTSTNSYVFDAATLTLEWTITGRGGEFVGIGDLEGDGVPEIVISGSEGHVMNGVTRTYKWGYVGGFGATIAMGDVDGDGKVEIVGAPSNSRTVTIVDGDTTSTSSFTMTGINVAQTIGVGDADNDGQPEIIVGQDQWGEVRGYRRDGMQLWYVTKPEWGVFSVAAGDVDGDGMAEVVWSSDVPRR